MTFLAPWSLLGLLALPAIVALHMFRRRLRERRVAGLFLFPPLRETTHGGRILTRLVASASLFCELLAAAALVLWLARPVLGGAELAPHLVVVLDDSASMAATANGSTAADRARAIVRRVADDLGRRTRVTVLTTGPRPTVAAGPRAPFGALDEVLDAWTPQQRHHDPLPTLDLAAQMGPAGDRLLFVTDDASFRAPPRWEVWAVGAAAPNAALGVVRRARQAGVETLYADVLTFGRATMTTRLTVDAGTAGAPPILTRELTLEPGHPLRVTLPLPRGTGAVHLALAADALAIDNERTLLPEPPRIVHVHSLLAEDVARALRIERILGVVEDVRVVPALADADLVLAPAAGALRPGRSEIVVAKAGEVENVWIGPYLLDRRAPVLDGITLDGVAWVAGAGTPRGAPLVMAGDDVLLAEEDQGDAIRWQLNLSPLRGNLAAAPDWPIFVANAIERVRAGLPGLASANVRLGDEVVWRRRDVPTQDEAWDLVDAAGVRERGRGARELGFAPRRTGVHRLLAGEREVGAVSVFFEDAAESDLSTAGERHQIPEEPLSATPDPVEGRIEGRLLALIALLCLVADWWVLRRGGTA